MNLIPLGDRVLIRPDQAPEKTESGLHLVEHWKPEQVGTVVSVGKTDELKVGDYVIFSWSAGNEFRIGDDGERLLCLRACDVLAVIDPESVNA